MDLYLGIAVVVATLLGPVLAVWVTRIVDKSRERRSRQLEVFRSLMRSRRSALSPEYVSALNTVEIEFAGVKPVEEAQRQLFQHLGQRPQAADWIDRLQRYQTRLLYTIAKHLGFEVEQLDVLEGGYLPQAWGTSEEENQAIRAGVLQVLSGTRALKIEAIGPAVGTAPPNSSAGLQVFAFKGSGVGGRQSYGLFSLSDGILAGSDIYGGTYQGSYKIDGTKILLTGSVNVSAGAELLTGLKTETATSVPMEAEWVLPIPEAQPLLVNVGGQQITISVERLTKV